MHRFADIRAALGGLWRSKGFAASASLTLALGIAATTTIFSVVYGVLLRPLPYRQADRLVVIQGEKQFSTGPRIMNYSPAEFEEFAAATSAFSAIAMVGNTSLTARTDAGVEPLGGATVSDDFFALMGAPALVGRPIGGEREPNIVISERLWRRIYGGATDVLGRAVRFADRENVERVYTIVGVMPSTFQYPNRMTDVWRPLAFVRAAGDDRVAQRNRGGFSLVARLKDGVSFAVARDDAARANAVLQPTFVTSRIDMYARVVTLGEFIHGTIGPALWILFGAVGLVLLVACANVASLILARQVSRTREVAMRLALGAPRARLVSHLLTESAIVGVAGGLIGVVITFGTIRLLQWVEPSQLPRLDAIAVDRPVMLFAAMVAITTALLSGIGPAILATRSDASLAMRSGSRGGAGTLARRARSALVVVEIAATVVLLVGAGLLSRSLAAMIDADLGVNTENVMTAQLDLALGRSLSPARQTEIAEALAERVSAIPSVRAAGFGTGLPPAGEFMRVSFVLSNAANDSTVSHLVTSVPASPGYFEALQIPLLKGRFFTRADTAAASPSVIVNREAARRFFGSDDPIGRTLPLGRQAMNVVGVVENVKYTGITSPDEGVIYRPFGQSPFRLVILVARTTGDPARIAAELRQVIRTYDPDISIGLVQPLTSRVSDAVAQPRYRAVMISAIAVITLVLAMIGLYGVIAYSTAQRTTEIGVRMAVGAQRSDVMRMVIGEGSRLAVAGIVAGLAASYWLTQLLAAFLYRVTATDPTAFAGSAAALFLVALLAVYVPARRAAGVDPIAALRTD